MRRVSIHPSVVLAIVAVCMLFASIGGADFARYRQWAAALLGGDIFLIGSAVGSPLGIPLTHWSFGPGLVFVVPQLVLGDVVDANSGPLVAGWLATLLFWWAYFRIFSWASRGDFALTALGAGAAFLGTHAGFLTRAHASESLSIALVALLVAGVVDPRRGLVTSSWIVGCSTALLVATRSYYAVYALPALLLAAGRIFDLDFARVNSDGGATDGVPRRVVAASLLSAPLLIAIVEQGLLNRWMTGSVTSSPYAFGDATYSSVAWLAPLFSTVLAHPWHGLLVYHPLYAVGFVAALICWVRAPSRRERILWAGAIVAVVINLWIQAAWYVWWLGTGTFGMRGMAPAAVVLVPALVRVVADAGFAGGIERVARARVWALGAVPLCLWSFLILLQGRTQFYSSSDVFAAQWETLARLLELATLPPLLAATFMVAGGWLWAHRRGCLAGADPLVLLASATLWLLSLHYVLISTRSRWNSGNAKLFLPAVLMIVLIASIFVVGRLLLDLVGRPSHQGRDSGSASDQLAWSLAGLSITLVFVIGTALFGRLAFTTERRLASGEIPDRRYRYVASFEIERAVVSLREYQRIDGFEDRKEALRSFLIAQGANLSR